MDKSRDNNLNLLNNQKGHNRALTPTPIRSIVVRDSKSAKILLSRTLSKLQKKEVEPTYARNLIYGVSQFLAAEKLTKDWDEVSEYLSYQALRLMESVEVGWNEILDVIEGELGREKCTVIKKKYSSKLKEIEQNIKTQTEEAFQEIRKLKDFPNKILSTDNFENTKNLIMTKCRRQMTRAERKIIIDSLLKID